MFKKLKDKKGFTLVELIVVLVILAILAALLIPALTGYIDKANQEKVIAETRQVTMAAQSVLSEAYGKAEISTSTTKADLTKYMDDIEKLAEIDGKGWTIAITVSNVEGEVGQIKTLSLWDGSYGCVYKDGQYYTKDDAKASVTVPTAKAAGTKGIDWATAEKKD